MKELAIDILLHFRKIKLIKNVETLCTAATGRKTQRKKIKKFTEVHLEPFYILVKRSS